MSDEVIDTWFGKFLIDPRDLIGSTLRAGTVWDGPGFLQVIARDYALHRRGTVIDVGANQGAWTIWLAYHGVRVVAVEPVPAVVQRLKANLDLNKATCAERVIVVPRAAYDGQTTMLEVRGAVDHTNTGGTALRPARGEGERLPAVAIDDLAFLWASHGVSLIKIDAQGADGAILFGLRDTLSRWHPPVVFEWEASLAEVHGYPLADVLDFLHDCGYAAHRWPSHPDNYLALWKGSE